MQGDAEDVLRPGEEYTVWQSSSEPAEEYSKVVEHGSRWAGIGREYLCEVVLSFELRLKRSKTE